MRKLINSIGNWSDDDRPGDKLVNRPADMLSNSEILAILIGTGTSGRNAVELAKGILKMVKGDLQELGKLTVYELMKIKGIGYSKANAIIAALELGRRRQAGLPLDRVFLGDTKDVAIYLQARLKDYQYEVFGVIYLNGGGKVLQINIISQGGIMGTIADPRLILKKALEEYAVSLILFHNHPSGNLIPSKADKEMTEKMKNAASYFDIYILDHIIVSSDGYYSFAKNGLLP